ncbi:MAG TPA: restriction endonuclease subunit S [Nitrospira sp.]|nr:restriction endonuclease subunit S [Nitrospira sp.]
MSSVSEVQKLPELPPTWRWSSMDQACLKIQDGTHFSPKNQRAHGKYRYITAKNVKPSGLDLSDVSYLSEADHRMIYKRCDPQKGDVLLVKDGVNTGDAALNTLNEEFSLLSSVCLLRPRSDLISSPFLRYFILSPVGYRLLTGQMTGTAIKRIVLRRIKDSPVPIAPMSEQQRIVAEIEKQFSRLDEAVASLKRVKANLKRYKAAVLKAAVEGKLTEDWRKQHPDVEPASKLLERVLADRRAKWDGKGKYQEPSSPGISNLPNIPDGWTWATLDQLLREPLRNGHSAKASGNRHGLRAFTLSAVTEGDFSEKNTKLTVAHTDKVADLWAEPGDIYVERSNTPELVGLARLYKGPSKFAFIPDLLIRVRLIHVVSAAFVEVCLLSEDCRRYFRSRAQGISGSMPKIDQSVIEQTPIPLPTLVEQQEIVAEVERRLSVIDELEETVEANLTRAERLRQSVLGAAFRGELNGKDRSFR